MKLKKILAAVLVLCMSVQLFCACSGSKQDTGDKVHVGVTYYDQSDTFLGELLSGFKEQLKNAEMDGLETTVMIRDAGGSQKTQNDQVKELIDAGCNVLCVNLVDRSDPSEIIDLAREYEVPIIFFNREPVAEDMLQWDRLYYVGADARQSGKMQGELAAEMIKEDSKIDRNRDGKIQYVVMEGEPGHQDAIIRTETVVETLRECGVVIDKKGCQIANWNRAQAQNRMEQMISQYQNQIELVLANNDDMALGALDAYKKLNYTETNLPLFFGIDGTDAGLEAVANLRLGGTVYNDKEGQAEVMARLAASLVTGKGMEEIELTNDKYCYLPYSKITIDNVGEFLGKEK